MSKYTKDNMLIQINKDNVFYKIKKFFQNLFNKKDFENAVPKTNLNDEQSKNAQKEQFLEYIRNTENEETKLLKLQKQYRLGEIKEDELTQEQVHSLCVLYDRQIDTLEKSNEIKKQKILNYKRKFQA